MYQLYPDLARAQQTERIGAARHRRRAAQVALARRHARRAEQAALQARLVLARSL